MTPQVLGLHNSARTVAIVDDNTELCVLLQRFLQQKGYEVSIFAFATQFLQQSCDHFDMVLLDLFMPDTDGVTVIRQLAEQRFSGAILLMSGENQGVLRAALELAKAQHLQQIATLQKPFGLEELSVHLQRLLGIKESRQIQRQEWMPGQADLVQAIALQQLVLFYQPKMNLVSKSCCGFEALLRWQHPQHGLVMPDRFICLAEQSSSLMQQLTDEVIRLAIAQLALWMQQGHQVTLSINVSMLNLVRLDFPDELQYLLLQHQLSTAQLQLEVTETALMNEVTTSLDILLRLKMKGFALSIDDFGTGYSSLAQLHRIPFSELKIDRSFVMAMQHCQESRAIVETCIKLAKRLGLSAVAEGVENEVILQSLNEMGCDMGQGYLWSKAVPASDAQRWLAPSG